MAQVVFSFNGNDIIIQCNINEKMEEILKKFCIKVGKEINSLYFIYSGNYLNNDELTFEEIANKEDKERNKMNILVTEKKAQTQTQIQQMYYLKALFVQNVKKMLKLNLMIINLVFMIVKVVMKLIIY